MDILMLFSSKEKKQEWDRNKKMEILALSNKLSKVISGENIVIFYSAGLNKHWQVLAGMGEELIIAKHYPDEHCQYRRPVMEINCTCDCGRPFNCLCKFHGELLLNSDLHFVYAFVYWLPTKLSVLNKNIIYAIISYNASGFY